MSLAGNYGAPQTQRVSGKRAPATAVGMANSPMAFRVMGRSRLLLTGASAGIIGLAAGVASAGPILQAIRTRAVADPSELVWVVPLAATAVVLLSIAYRELLIIPYEIRVGTEGAVEMARVLGSKLLHVEDIYALATRAESWTSSESGDVVASYYLDLCHRRGRTTVHCFPDADRLIATLIALKPSLYVKHEGW